MSEKKKIKTKNNENKNKSSAKSISKTSLTMADLLKDNTQSKLTFKKVGETVEGVITSIDTKSVVLDIGGKCEGILVGNAFNEAKGLIKHLKVGDKVKGRVLISETPEGYSVISLRNASQDYFWDKLRSSFEKGEELGVNIKGSNPSGIIVDVSGLQGFVPITHVGRNLLSKLSEAVGKTIQVKIIELDRKFRRIVLSEKAVSEKERLVALEQAMGKVKEGQVLEGTVSAVLDFGIFVKVFLGKDKKQIPVEGLVHVSELTWDKVDRPSDHYKRGDEVKVYVMGIKDGKLSLSIKHTSSDPWVQAADKYKVEGKARGKISKISDFGVFVSLEPGIEGLIHLTKIPPGKRFTRGEEVNVTIDEVDVKNKKISLAPVLTSKPIGYK